MELGRSLERADMIARLLMTRSLEGTIGPNWTTLLRSCSAHEAYLRTVRSLVTEDRAAEFLIVDRIFPRSIAYCVHSAYDRLADIRPPERHDLPGGSALEQLRVLDAWVTERTSEPLGSVHQLLTHVVDEVHEICGLLGKELLGNAA